MIFQSTNLHGCTGPFDDELLTVAEEEAEVDGIGKEGKAQAVEEGVGQRG